MMQMKQGNCQSRRTLLQGLTAAGGAALLGPSMIASASGQGAVDPRVAKIVEDTISVDMTPFHSVEASSGIANMQVA